MNFLRIIDKAVDFTAAALCSVLLIAIVLVGGANVFYRYVLNDAVVWSDEFLRYAFVWLGFMAGHLTVKHDGHICIDEVPRRLKPKARAAVYVLTRVLCALYLCILIPCGFILVGLTGSSKASVLPITFNYIYAAVPVAGIFSLWALLRYVPGQAKAVLEEGEGKE